MNIVKNQRKYTDYRLDRSENDSFYYDGQSKKFEWVQDHIIEYDDGSCDMECNVYSLNESDYFHNPKLVKEIKEFKSYVNNQINKGV